MGDRTLVSASNDKTIKARPPTPQCFLPAPSSLPSSRPGAHLLDPQVWDLERRECLRTLTGHTEWVNAVAVEPNGHVVVSLSKDRSIKVISLPRANECKTTLGPSSF